VSNLKLIKWLRECRAGWVCSTVLCVPGNVMVKGLRHWAMAFVLLTKYYSGGKVKWERWVGHVACRVLVRKPKGESPLGKPRCGWEDNIKVDF
jgi:hypothetical protein